jgi:hypothetical protein
MRTSGRRVVWLRSSGPSRRTQIVASWARALVPTAVLVVTPLDLELLDVADGSGLEVDVDGVVSGPLALADAIAKAAAGSE